MQKDKEIVELIPSFNKLKEWSDKQKCSVLFDSKIDGDGERLLEHRVFNKTNLYFISFDNENNVFGGYVNTIINKTGYITDSNAFTFSLIRNGKLINNKYNIKNSDQSYSFNLQSKCDLLYHFGYYTDPDICVFKISNQNSYCDSHSYEYNEEKQPFRDKTYPNRFAVKRILVIEMN